MAAWGCPAECLGTHVLPAQGQPTSTGAAALLCNALSEPWLKAGWGKPFPRGLALLLGCRSPGTARVVSVSASVSLVLGSPPQGSLSFELHLD